MTRIALLHTGAVVIPTFAELMHRHLPEVEVQHLLDDKIVADLGAGAGPDQIGARLGALGRAAKAAGAAAVVFTCSSVSGYARQVADEIDLPVYRIDEAMADRAVATGNRIAVIATLRTTLDPTAALLRERARVLDRQVELATEVVDDAFAAVVAGDQDRHNALVGDAIARHAVDSDVVVLAQASMAKAAEGLGADVTVLTSPELGVRRLADRLGSV